MSNGLSYNIWAKQQIYTHLPSFKSRNFRLFFGGQTLSLSGTFMSQVTVSWLVYDLTHAASLLGLTGFLQFVPTLFLSPLSGVLSDRWSRRNLLIVVQILGIIVSISLTTLAFLDKISFQVLIAASILSGMLKGLDMPVRYAIVTETVDDRADWNNAIALYSAMLSSSLLIGPALGGMLIASLGAKYCFLYDSFSYGVALITLMAMQLKATAPEDTIGRSQTAWQKLREGFEYAYSILPIRIVLVMLGLQGLVGISYTALLPVFAADILGGGARTLGFLSAAGPIGSIIACVCLSLRRQVLGLEKLMGWCPIAMGLGSSAFASSQTIGLSLAILVVVGAAGTLQISTGNTIVQSLVPDDKRGRVMSLYSVSVVGTLPLGNLLAGNLAESFGAPNALIYCGIASLLGAAWYLKRLSVLTAWIEREVVPQDARVKSQ